MVSCGNAQIPSWANSLRRPFPACAALAQGGRRGRIFGYEKTCGRRDSDHKKAGPI